jgi:hypothetical protein
MGIQDPSCCQQMQDHLLASCADHPDRFDCPDALIAQSSGGFGLIVHDGGSSSVTIRFCPWCGADLSGERRPELRLETRVIDVPPGLPVDDLGTPELFAACIGKTFEVIGRNGDLVELAVGTVRGQAPYMHSIWIEEQFTDLSFPQLCLSEKMLRFVIEAVEFRITAFTRVIDDPDTSEDDVSDASNDRGLLMAARNYLIERSNL